MTADAVLRFWFEETDPRRWWEADAAFDALVRERFGELQYAASRAELHAWRTNAAGRLAEILVLDQFSRNIHRGAAAAFACDGMALVLAQEAVARQLDAALPINQRAFLYMPYMHSESLAIHEHAVQLFSRPGLESNLEFELKHKRILERFGRYPHRNRILERESTPAESEFLEQAGSSF